MLHLVRSYVVMVFYVVMHNKVKKNKTSCFQVLYDKLLGEWAPRELWPSEVKNLGDQIETVSSYKKNFFIIELKKVCQSYDNSSIFKNLIWNEILTATFAASCRKYFKFLKFYLKLIGQELLLFSYILKNQSLKFSFSTWATLSNFAVMEFTIKEDLIERQRYILLLISLRPWFAYKQKFSWKKPS